MVTDTDLLFEPVHIGAHTLRNRIVMPPMVANRDIREPAGIGWYARRAQGGVGLVIVEATAVNRFRSGAPEDVRLTAESLAPLVQTVHAAEAKIAIQLFPVTRGVSLAPADLSLAEIAELLEDYETAAQICAEAGFDGVEPHGAHGYLLNQFLSPVQNARTDSYGGSLQNRMRLAQEVVVRVRAALPEGMLLLYRHTPVGQGYGVRESLDLAAALVTAGVDVLDLSPSSIDGPGDRSVPFTDLGVPVVAVNRLDEVDRAVEVLKEGRADLIAVGRGLIADPDWALKVAKRPDVTAIVRCIRCDGCHRDLRAGVPVRCTQWDGDGGNG